MIYILIFILGSIIGSFLNVCIYRIPRNESILFPGSRCPSCKSPIPWFDNIPFLSYIFLKGRCRFCGKRLSFRYFTVELLSALSFLILFIHFGWTSRFWLYSLLTFGLIVISFIDLEFQIIPDTISIGGVFLGIILSIFVPELHNEIMWKWSLLAALLGILAGAGAIYSIRSCGNLALYCARRLGVYFRRNLYLRKIFSRYRHMKESMGMGDVGLMAMLGAFLGWKMAVLIFFLAPFFGAPVGIYLKFKKKCDIIPYGPYLSIASFVAILWGQKILDTLFA